MRKALLALAVVAALFVGMFVMLAGTATATPPNPDHKVTLCHRTGSATNPYIVITTDIASDGYVKGGHNNHEQVGNGLGGDIIPAYEYVAKDGSVFDYPGKNLDTIIGGATGADILANGCIIPGGEVTPPTFAPAAALTDGTCADFITATLDNSASVDGSEESATVTFTIAVNGSTVDTVDVAAGDIATVKVGVLKDGDTVTVSAGDDTLATGTVDDSDCGSGGGDHNPPPTNNPPKAQPPVVATPPALAETL